MKKSILLALALLISISVKAQVPQALNFQGLATNANGLALATQPITVKAELLKGAPTGSIVYSETHQTSTNQAGLYTLQIGMGTPVLGSFKDIDWSSGSIYLSVSISITGNNNFTLMGVSQLLSVPYALVAGKSLEDQPKIFVTTLPNSNSNILDLDQYNNVGGIIYEWISGNPETVYVDYKNLPPGIDLYSATEIFSPIIKLIPSKTDTIDYGHYQRPSRLYRTNPNQNVPAGKYDVTLTYRTATTVLKTITITLEVAGNQQSCIEKIVGQKTLTNVACFAKDTLGQFSIDSTIVGTFQDDILSKLVGTKMDIFGTFSIPNYDTLQVNNYLNTKSCGITIFNCLQGTGNGMCEKFGNNYVIHTRKVFLIPEKGLRFEVSVDMNNPTLKYSCLVDYR